MLSFGKVIFTLSVIILLGLPVYHNVGQALEPNQIAIIANLNSTDSQAIAEYYCQKRGIPASQILSIDMSETESVSRDTYTRGIAPPIRSRLLQPDLKDKIKCLVAVRGVPLKIGPYQPVGEKKKWRDLIIRQLDERFGQLKQLTSDYQNQIKSIDSEPVNVTPQKLKYDLLYEVGGLNAVCRILLHDRLWFDDEKTHAAFDSELSLILWDSYRLSQWQNNILRSSLVKLLTSFQPPANPQPVLMVSRLDGPSRKIALGLIDKALAAEKRVLQGSAYIDARGINHEINKYGSFIYFDESLRRTAQQLKQHTHLKVILDNKAPLFPPQACPRNHDLLRLVQTPSICRFLSIQRRRRRLPHR
jgi:uncharacterized protein (TIGR03790 family)